MWHEARKQEKLIRGMIVDYRRRAERRKDFYEKIKAEPTQFLQLHGRRCKVHLDPAVAAAGEGPAIMMQWQGDPNNLIDRFDVRAHLDFIPETKFPDIPIEELSQEERQCNYERYRILSQNAFLGINEDKFLQQLAIEEQFGVTLEEKEMQKGKLHEKKGTGAAIGYNYNDPDAQPSSSNGPESKKVEQKDSDDDSDLEILDVDLSIDVNKMEPSQAHDLNAVGPQFGMAGCDLFSFLTGDADDAEHQKQILREEKEKAMYSGRKSRRERRAHRDKKLASRVMSPPSYAAPPEPARSPPRSRSASRSPSPDAGEKIEFITSFGGDEDEVKPPPLPKPLYSEKLKYNLKKQELYSEVTRKNVSRFETEDNYSRPIGPRGPNSRSPSTISSRSLSLSKSRSRSPTYKKSRSRSRSYSRSRSFSRSRSRSYDSYKRSRSRSRSRNRGRRSRSPANNSAKRNKSRSMSYESNDRGPAAKTAVPRYYGRRKEDKSSSELSLDSDSSDSDKNKSSVGNKSNTNQNQLRSSGSSSKGPVRDTSSLKDKLKKKMQAQLARQLRADKRAEAERQERESRKQARRDEEMRELAIKLRRKQREMRHKYRRSSDESDRSRSRSSSRDSGPPGDMKHSRSRSQSPQEKRPPVWEHESEPPAPFKPRPPKPDDNPQDERRHHPDDHGRDYPETRRDYDRRSRSPSPKGNPPVWEGPREIPSYPDSRRRYPEESRYQDGGRKYPGENRYQDEGRRYPEEVRYQDDGRRYPEGRYQDDTRYQNDERPDYQRYDPRGYQGNQRYEQTHYDNRWDSSRRPYGHRGGYRGYRPGPGGDGPGPSWSRETDTNWSRDSQDYRKSDGNRNNVKLVDY